MKSFQMFVLQGKLIGNPVCQDTPYGEMALVQIEETSFFHEDCHQIHRVLALHQAMQKEFYSLQFFLCYLYRFYKQAS